MEVIDKSIELVDVCFWWEAPLPRQGSTHKGEFGFDLHHDSLYFKNIYGGDVPTNSICETCAFSEKPPYHGKVAHKRGIFFCIVSICGG